MIKIPEINLHLGDCMDWMREKPNGYYDLAVVDPPYGIGASDYKRGGTQHGKSASKSKVYSVKQWDKETPQQSFFDELLRVSKNVIIWGGNYFHLPPTSCWVIWDKDNGDNGYADFEMAWTSFSTAGRFAKITWHGMRQHDMKNKETRIHPTQKPVALYKWLLTNYAKPGDRILDTHGGSGSSMIACYDLGFDMDWIELDPDYFKSAKERFERHKAQGQLFHIAETLPEQQKLF